MRLSIALDEQIELVGVVALLEDIGVLGELLALQSIGDLFAFVAVELRQERDFGQELVVFVSFALGGVLNLGS